MVNFATAALAIVLLPFYTRTLNPEEYGIYATIVATGEIIGMFMSFRLDSTFGRYFFENNQNEETMRRLFSTCFWSVCILGLIVYPFSLLLGYFYFHQSLGIQFAPLILLGFFTPFLNQLGLLNIVYFTQTHQSKFLAVIKIAVLVFTHLFSICLLLFTELKVNARIIPILIGAGIAMGFYLRLIRKKRILGFVFDFPLLIQILPYSLAMMPTVAAVWINTLSDRIILAIYGRMDEAGIYSVGFQIGKSLMFISMAITAVYTPILYARLSENFDAGIKSLRKPLLGVFWLMALLSSYLFLFSPEIIGVLLGREFHDAGSILGIIIFSFFVGSQHVIFSKILAYKKRMLLLTIMGLASALPKLIFNIIFIPIYGKFAAAWSTLGTAIIYALLMIYFVRKGLHLDVDWMGFIKTLMILFVMFSLYGITVYFIAHLGWIFFIKLLIVLLTLFLSKIMNVFDKKTMNEMIQFVRR